MSEQKQERQPCVVCAGTGIIYTSDMMARSAVDAEKYERLVRRLPQPCPNCVKLGNPA